MSSNTTLYYSAKDDVFKDLLVETNAAEQQVDTKREHEEPLTDTPKRLVRIRKHNLFAKDMQDTQDFFICRRMPQPVAKIDVSPTTRELRKELQGNEMLRLRRERYEAENKKPMRRLTLRI